MIPVPFEEGSAKIGSVRTALRDVFAEAIAAAYPGMSADVAVAACAQPKFGDYQCNNAMALHGALRKAGREDVPKAPRAVAEAIVARVDLESCPMIESTSLAGPGFINIRLSRAWLGAHVKAVLAHGPAAALPRIRKRVVIDFSSPNVAKEMHVGHLRSTIIGDTLARTLELCGADVLRLNHVGDWGTQFGMLIQYMREEAAGGLGGADNGAADGIADLMAVYRQSKQWFDRDEAHKERAREAVTRLQAGDPESLEVWRRICAASRAAFNQIYSRLGVTLTERGESFYNAALSDVVEELAAKGLLEESDGAKVFWGYEDRERHPPLIVQKRDGGYGYASTDLAAIRQRVREEKADWVIYVTDVGQAGHFDLVFRAARAAGWLPLDDAAAATEGGTRVSHVGFGLVLGEDGKRMKTRSGELVRLVELLDEAKDRCASTIRQRASDAAAAAGEAPEATATAGGEADADPLDIDSKAAILGYGAVKYADLKNSRLTNYKFDFDEMLSLRGNTAVYLQYAHARVSGIIRKAGVDVVALAASADVELTHDSEVALALHVARFPEAIEEALSELMPNRITEYLYALSEVLNTFYGDCRVLGSDTQASRLLLLEATAATMRLCLTLLGIQPLYRI